MYQNLVGKQNLYVIHIGCVENGGWKGGKGCRGRKEAEGKLGRGRQGAGCEFGFQESFRDSSVSGKLGKDFCQRCASQKASSQNVVS